ncbi:30481_t:CDS:1, partial [Gigaspora margarita]
MPPRKPKHKKPKVAQTSGLSGRTVQTPVDIFYYQKTVKSGNRYYVCRICNSYLTNRSNEHINNHSQQERECYCSLFYRNQYTPRRVSDEQTTPTPSSSNQPLPVVDVKSESRASNDGDDSRDSTQLPVEFSEEETEESTEESSEESSNDL